MIHLLGIVAIGYGVIAVASITYFLWEVHRVSTRAISRSGHNPGSVKSQAERVLGTLGTRKRRALVGRERRC